MLPSIAMFTVDSLPLRSELKQPNLKLKTRPKQLLGSHLLTFALTLIVQTVTWEWWGYRQSTCFSWSVQGMLTEGEGSVQLTSSLRYLVLQKKVNYIFNIKRR
jgi:hypothetical protein